MHGIFGNDSAIAMCIGHIRGGAQNLLGIYVAVATIGNTVGTTRLMMEVTGGANVVAITVGIFNNIGFLFCFLWTDVIDWLVLVACTMLFVLFCFGLCCLKINFVCNNILL